MLRGTVRKRALAGGITFVTGLATAVVGLSAGTALAAPTTLTYTCTGTARELTLSVMVSGTVAGTPKVGEPVTLDGFQAILSITDVQFDSPPVAHVTGTIRDLTISATDAQGGDAGSSLNTNLPFDVQPDAGGLLSVSIPASPLAATGFTATAEGLMTFSLPAEIVLPVQVFASSGTQLDDFTLTCDTTDSTFASVNVAPDDNGDGGTQTGGDGGDDNGDDGDNGNTSPPPTQDNPTTPPPTSNNNADTTSGALASTGVPYTIPLTATGAALLLLGGGMLVAGRRRRRFVVEGPAEGPTSEEPGTRD